MIGKFAEFFLSNRRITVTLIVIIAIFGSIAYALLPKQYNPSIVAPAFSITIPSASYSSAEASQFVAKTLENTVRELQWIDSVYSYATDGFSSVMVAFEVGVDQEIAKTRLYDKLYSNYDLRPFGIENIWIRSIDPEELPQVAFAFTYSWTDLDETRAGVYLRSIAMTVKEEVKHVPGTTVVDVLGWYRNDFFIELDRWKMESFGLDILKTIETIRSSFEYSVVWNIETENQKIAVLLNTALHQKRVLELLLVSDVDGKKILLGDIATIHSGPTEPRSFYRYATSNGEKEAVFLAVAKLPGTNAVSVVANILEKIQEIEKTLPKNVSITVIQNEGMTAKDATNELMIHLFVSIAIVLGILIVFLGMRDALNAAFCIPMVLGIVFLVGFIFGLDINRITLFALILSLWILVDDSIVMVENNSRHLSMIPRTGKSPVQAVLSSVQEVGASIVFSTITRIMSFIAMFAVTGMMGDYMKPIPIFASIALTASLFIAFSINPFLAVIFYNRRWETHHDNDKEKTFISWYGKILWSYINRTARSARNRKLLKIGFWMALGVIVLLPIALDVFKARMLPKADKDQVYLWIDAPKNTPIETVRVIGSRASGFLLGKEWNIPEDLRIVESLSSAIWDRFLGDFANLFRGGQNRIYENQISMRINLRHAKHRDISSEAYVIQVRPLLRQYLFQTYPDITIRLLEDPPGPPTQATFHIKVKGQENLWSEELMRFANAVHTTVKTISEKQDLVDLSDTISSAQQRLRVELDNVRVWEAGLSVPQVSQTLRAFFQSSSISLVHSDSKHVEPTNILIGFSKDQRKDISTLSSLVFTNPQWKKIYLSDIAEISSDISSRDIYTDNRAETIHLYAELGNNSVVYPILELYELFGNRDFEAFGYRKIWSNPYGIEFVGTTDGKKYRIEWGWEWELTMDTFRDLGLAMILSLAAIYFLIVVQFGSFLIGGITMTTFLLSFFGIFPGFSILYLINGTYFTATAMIGAIALGGIVVGNAIILIDYINQLLKEGNSLEYSVIEGAKKRFIPVMLTSIAAVAWSFIITGDPVWSGLAWAIVWGLSASAVLTLIFIPISYYSFLRKYHSWDAHTNQMQKIMNHAQEMKQS